MLVYGRHAGMREGRGEHAAPQRLRWL